jgi:hypothetical protein
LNARSLSTLLFAGLACTQAPTEFRSEPLVVEVVQLSRAEPEAELALRLINSGVAPVHFEGCPDVPSVVLERRDQLGWQEVGSVNIYCIAVLSPRRELLRPGATIEAKLRVVVRGEIRVRVLYGASPEEPYAAAALSRPIRVD